MSLISLCSTSQIKVPRKHPQRAGQIGRSSNAVTHCFLVPACGSCLTSSDGSAGHWTYSAVTDLQVEKEPSFLVPEITSFLFPHLDSLNLPLDGVQTLAAHNVQLRVQVLGFAGSLWRSYFFFSSSSVLCRGNTIPSLRSDSWDDVPKAGDCNNAFPDSCLSEGKLLKELENLP